MSHLLSSSSTNNQATTSSFVHTSALAASPHDPFISLSSHCIRHAFGPTVQLVADALQSRGPSSLGQLLRYLQVKCPAPPRRLGLPESKTADAALVRGALLVLIQHHIVDCQFQKNTTVYRYNIDRARNLMRHARYVEFMKKAVDETAASAVQTLLLLGQLRTVDWIEREVQQTKNNHRLTARQQVVAAAHRLVTQGFVQIVPPIRQGEEGEDGDDDAEYEFGEPPPTKKVRIQEPESPSYDEDPAVLSLIKGNAAYQASLPIDTVWRINVDLFHDYSLALYLGRLVSDRYSQKVRSCGSLVTAALKYRAQQQHVTGPQQKLSYSASAGLTTFTPSEIVKFLPKPVLQIFEKKAGGLSRGLAQAFEELTKMDTPQVVRRIGAAHPEPRFEITVGPLLEYLQTRVVHQLIYDRHGEVAARIITILEKQGWMESDALAEQAMVPAKDTREILHCLYRSRYVELLQLSSRQQYNPANIIYLWGVQRKRLWKKIAENVAEALWKIRLRRQHQLQMGKDWVERAQTADADENDHETDRLNYQKFCLGLERLDFAALQLDDTLMVMHDFRPLNLT